MRGRELVKQGRPEPDGALFGGLEILELAAPGVADPCRRAVAAAGRLARQMGATVWSDGAPDLGPDRGFAHGAVRPTADMTEAPAAWASNGDRRVLLLADTPDHHFSLRDGSAINVVRVVADPWHNEATLFAASGLSDCLLYTSDAADD